MTDVQRQSERRRGARAPVALQVEERTGDALYFQRASNLSETGIWLEGTLAHPPGTRVELDLALPAGAVRVAGVVVGRDAEGVGMAVRFVDMTDAVRARISAALASARS
ncbi:MAG TPA: PilZ domain-containing protein [Polyangiaceae bacterium]|jgi:hypothetical protein|nr:PilZ domain-containing protein [Polyangiaceae bacterium]